MHHHFNDTLRTSECFERLVFKLACAAFPCFETVWSDSMIFPGSGAEGTAQVLVDSGVREAQLR